MVEGISMMKGGGSVLAAMTGEVEKQAAKRGPKPALTALPNEVPGASMLRPVSPLGQVSTPAAFPNDVPLEAIRALIRDLELQREHLTGVIDGLRLLAGEPAVVAATIAQDAATTARLLEREADRRAAEATTPAVEMTTVVSAAEARDRKRAMMLTALTDAGNAPDVAAQVAEFAGNFEAQKVEAQASAFTPTPTASDGWTCPTHGQAVEKTSARRGVKYQGCPVPGCQQFERL